LKFEIGVGTKQLAIYYHHWIEVSRPNMFAFVIYEREIPISSRNKTQELKHLEANSLMKQSHFLSILEPRIEPSDRLKIRRFLSKLLPLVCQISSHSESMFGT